MGQGPAPLGSHLLAAPHRPQPSQGGHRRVPQGPHNQPFLAKPDHGAPGQPWWQQASAPSWVPWVPTKGPGHLPSPHAQVTDAETCRCPPVSLHGAEGQARREEVMGQLPLGPHPEGPRAACRFQGARCQCPRLGLGVGGPRAGVSLLFGGISHMRASPLPTPPPLCRAAHSRALLLTQLGLWKEGGTSAAEKREGAGPCLSTNPRLGSCVGWEDCGPRAPFWSCQASSCVTLGRPLASLSLSVSFCSLGCHSPHLMVWLEGDAESPGQKKKIK